MGVFREKSGLSSVARRVCQERAMDDRALYATILGLSEPWEVETVELKEAEQAVHVWVRAQATARFGCSECGEVSPIYDHVERSWRHLDTCQFQTLLHARVPRVQCATHGVRTTRVPWAEQRSRFTLLFERLAIAWLKEATPMAVARRLGLTWEEANGIVERAVRRGLARRPSAAGRRLGIDEHSYLRPYQFVTMVCDLDTQNILYVGDDRRADTLVPYFEGLTPEERAGITAIAMDMWDPYRKTVRAYVPDADRKIVFDRFHVMQQVLEAVDAVRRHEHKELVRQGDRRLTNTKYLWLTRPDRLRAAMRAELRRLKHSTLKAARAWAIKEAVRHLWDYRSIPAARAFFHRWYQWAIRSRLPPIIQAARTLARHLENVLTYLTHRITNAVTEGLNAKIQWIKYSSRGFRDRERFKLAILFHCGGLDLEPRNDTLVTH
jgi:transposase